MRQRPIPAGSDVMPRTTWELAVQSGWFVKYDGSGYWATSKSYWLDSDAFDPAPEGATHVVWFNK